MIDKSDPLELADQPAVGYKGHIIRPKGFLSNDSPLRMKTGTSTPVNTIPGRTMGIVSMVVSIIGFGLIGLILGIVALGASKKVGQGNGFALAGIIVGILNIVAVIGLLSWAWVVYSQHPIIGS